MPNLTFALVYRSVVSAIPLISAGNNFNLTIRTNGRVWAWGNNTFGQLGDILPLINQHLFQLQVRQKHFVK